MGIKELKVKPDLEQHKKLHLAYTQLNELLAVLKTIDGTDEVALFINNEVDQLNNSSEVEKALLSQTKKTQANVLKHLEKELKLVPINHNRNLWLPIGIAAFGLPMGIVFGTSLGNMSFIAIGIPLGMVLGLAVGTHLDKKAAEEGLQIDFEIKY